MFSRLRQSRSFEVLSWYGTFLFAALRENGKVGEVKDPEMGRPRSADERGGRQGSVSVHGTLLALRGDGWEPSKATVASTMMKRQS